MHSSSILSLFSSSAEFGMFHNNYLSLHEKISHIHPRVISPVPKTQRGMINWVFYACIKMEAEYFVFLVQMEDRFWKVTTQSQVSKKMQQRRKIKKNPQKGSSFLFEEKRYFRIPLFEYQSFFSSSLSTSLRTHDLVGCGRTHTSRTQVRPVTTCSFLNTFNLIRKKVV